jgi:hypothetical protein
VRESERERERERERESESEREREREEGRYEKYEFEEWACEKERGSWKTKRMSSFKE